MEVWDIFYGVFYPINLPPMSIDHTGSPDSAVTWFAGVITLRPLAETDELSGKRLSSCIILAGLKDDNYAAMSLSVIGAGGIVSVVTQDGTGLGLGCTLFFFFFFFVKLSKSYVRLLSTIIVVS